jgi:hypothetical protein
MLENYYNYVILSVIKISVYIELLSGAINLIVGRIIAKEKQN